LRHKGIQDEVLRFYNNFYTTKGLTVVIIGNSDKKKESLDQFSSKIVEIFNKPVNSLSNKPKKLHLKNNGHFYDSKKLPGILFISGKSSPLLKISFDLSNSGKTKLELLNHYRYISFWLDKILTKKLIEDNFYATDIDSTGNVSNFESTLDIVLCLSEVGKSK